MTAFPVKKRWTLGEGVRGCWFGVGNSSELSLDCILLPLHHPCWTLTSLRWSIAIFLRFDQTLTVNLENRDFIKQAFKCLFSTQTDGTWRHYKPLFHYRKAGNAYCYVFETFAALLQCALRDGAKAEMFRDLLRPSCKNLMELWHHADSTKMDLWQGVDAKKKPRSATGKEIGWCSGHRTNVTHPESWATASVFSYAEELRRLVGIWCREEAFGS